MKKQQWVALLARSIEATKRGTWEVGQDQMIDAFFKDESERLNLFTDDDDVGHKTELEDLFCNFQGIYKYENGSCFETVSFNMDVIEK